MSVRIDAMTRRGEAQAANANTVFSSVSLATVVALLAVDFATQLRDRMYNACATVRVT